MSHAPAPRSAASGPPPRLARTAPFGAASYDSNVQERAQRAAAEIVGAVPELEGHEEAVLGLMRRVLSEQDRASRADEVLRRFSPSVRMYIQRHAGG